MHAGSGRQARCCQPYQRPALALQEQRELDQQLDQFRLAFDSGGLHGALRYLNARTSFRYTAVYRLDGQMMRNIHLYDRQGEIPLLEAVSPVLMDQLD